MTGNQDRRRESRVRTRLPVDLGTAMGVTRNVSLSGLYVETDAQYAVGSKINSSMERNRHSGWQEDAQMSWQNCSYGASRHEDWCGGENHQFNDGASRENVMPNYQSAAGFSARIMRGVLEAEITTLLVKYCDYSAPVRPERSEAEG